MSAIYDFLVEVAETQCSLFHTSKAPFVRCKTYNFMYQNIYSCFWIEDNIDSLMYYVLLYAKYISGQYLNLSTLIEFIQKMMGQ